MSRSQSPSSDRVVESAGPLDRATGAAFAEAVRLHGAGQTAAAAKLCQEILAQDPGHAHAVHLLGIIAYQAGHADRAVELMQRSIALNDRDPIFHNNLGNALARIGRLDAACESYERTLVLEPNHAEALFNMGNALSDLGRFDQAITAYQRSLTVVPAAETYVNLGNLLHRLGRFDDALAAFQAATILRPTLAEAHNSLGHVLGRLGRHQDALVALDRAIALNPNYAEAHNNRGNAQLALGAVQDAIASYRTALAQRGGYVSALNNLGNALFSFGHYEEARTHYEKALALDPLSAAVNNGLGNVLQKLGLWDEAVACYERAIALRSNFAEGWANLAAAHHGRRRYDTALICCDTALAIEPDRFEALTNRGNTLVALNRFDEAVVSYQRALALRPDAPEVLGNIGSALVELGRIDDALGFFDRALTIDPRRPKYHFLHVQAKRVSPGDPRLTALERLEPNIGSMPRDDRIDFHFALSKAYADTGQIDSAFPHMIAANGLKRRTIIYDEAAFLRQLNHLAQVFSKEMLETWKGLGNPSARPIFIIGMPRSGTTLVEQILASHPGVAAGGELNHLLAITPETLGPIEEFQPAFVPAADRTALISRIAAAYLAALDGVSPDAPRVTDKMPANFMLAGLIHLALPNATIIHTRRDPVDTCLSCFSTLFAGGLPYSYDLGEVGRYYRAYDRLMSHWRAVLPTQAILDVDYEVLVANFETQARRIVAQCGLTWSDACLAFHTTQRPVRTASATQVRQPLYTTAVARWRKIDPEALKPLTDALGPSLTGRRL